VRNGSPGDVLLGFRPGQRIFIQGGPGENVGLSNLLMDNPGYARGVEFWSSLVPGINSFDYGSLPGDAKLTTFMASTALEPSITAGRTRLIAMPYSEVAELLSRTEFDAAIFQTSPPDAQGRYSFAHSCDMPPIVWPNAHKRIVFFNEQMHSLPLGQSLPGDAVDLAIPINEPLLSPPPNVSRPAAVAEIARLAAGLVPDGATVQAGIGDTPAAVVAGLRLHRGLRILSGIITSEYQQLAESGALDAGAEHVAGVAWGDAAFRNWLPQSGFAFRSVLETHDHTKLAAIPGFVSIGSALEVDLTGNLNLEWRSGRRVSSVGGAPDYLRAATASAGGLSIIALRATSGNGGSRIVPTLKAPSFAGDLVDVVVTEHGIAQLTGLSGETRANALIAIAAPEHRAFLADARRRSAI